MIHLAILGVSIASWFAVAVVINVSISLSSFDWYDVFQKIMRSGNYWLTLLWFVVLLCGWESYVDGARRAFYYEPKHVLQEVSVLLAFFFYSNNSLTSSPLTRLEPTRNTWTTQILTTPSVQGVASPSQSRDLRRGERQGTSGKESLRVSVVDSPATCRFVPSEFATRPNKSCLEILRPSAFYHTKSTCQFTVI